MGTSTIQFSDENDQQFQHPLQGLAMQDRTRTAVWAVNESLV